MCGMRYDQYSLIKVTLYHSNDIILLLKLADLNHLLHYHIVMHVV